MPGQSAMKLDTEHEVMNEWMQIHQCITDRKSKFSVTIGRIEHIDDIKHMLKRLNKDKQYAKATHSMYAARIVDGSSIIERKNDDGETGAGMVILRILRKKNVVNCIAIVTRWYGGIKLQGDRFKHIQDATMLGLDECQLE